jgi:hypothetical protein
MPARDPSERSAWAAVAADWRWGNEADRHAATQPMRDGRTRKYEKQVDPGRVLSEEERQRRVASLLRSDMRRLAIRSAQARRARAEGRDAPAAGSGDAA